MFIARTLPGSRHAHNSPPSAELRRFLGEAQITAQLDPPGVVSVHELGTDAEGRVFFTMKLVRGRTLAEVLARLDGGVSATDAAAEIRADRSLSERGREVALQVVLAEAISRRAAAGK